MIVGLGVSTSTDADPVAAAVRAEELGFDFVSASDHPAGTAPTYETWTMLCFVAAATSRIGIATRVLGVPYRHPALVAKMAETLDRLSGGRLVLGLGGGSADEEHRMLGLGVRSPKEKTDGLEQAVQVIRGLWGERAFSFEGSLYRTDAAEVEPKPARRIPIWLGTFAPRALAVTGRLADGWIPSLGYASADELVAMRGRVLAAARAAGRDPGELTCAVNMPAADASLELLRRLAGAGFTAFNFLADGGEAERLAAEVLPVLRAE